MPHVTMYATHSCQFCQKALHWLAEHPKDALAVDIQFIDTDATARNAFQAHRLRGVPAFVTGMGQWSGWDPQRLVQVLASPEGNVGVR